MKTKIDHIGNITIKGQAYSAVPGRQGDFRRDNDKDGNGKKLDPETHPLVVTLTEWPWAVATEWEK